MIDFPKLHRVPYDGKFKLSDFETDPPKGRGGEAKEEAELAKSVEQLDLLQRRLFADERYALLTVFQAMDAAGKDSTIRKVFSGVNPAGFRVHAFGRPGELELRHDFLQRVSARLPERGKIGIFNRSHYEEVLVVRVNPAALAAQNLPETGGKDFWEGRFESIREFEEHLARNGTVVVKFWLNASRKVQKKRLLERIEDPEKNWKFRLGDLDDRAKWKDYEDAYEALLRATSRPYAPWYAIPADDKDYMRAAVAKILVETLESVDPEFPKLDAAKRAELAEGKKRLLAE
jgi:PPK2 family polyphosphate:nucleotide phosphotransferase